jgi:hypothetical protein
VVPALTNRCQRTPKKELIGNKKELIGNKKELIGNKKELIGNCIFFYALIMGVF